MEAKEKDEIQQLRDRLTVSPKLVWDVSDQAQRDAIFAYGEDYKAFLDRAKTERKAVDEIQRQAGDRGFVELINGSAGPRSLNMNWM